ncbi:MAG: BBP7 family outer membrane beta-barrel protein [Rubripirellula sp.]
MILRWSFTVLILLLVPSIGRSQTTVMPFSGGDPYAMADSQSTSMWLGNGFTMPTTETFRDRFWVELDYLRWRTEGSNVPALVTTSPNGTSASDAGVLGEPGTSILAGAGEINDSSTNGARWRSGIWCRNGQFGFESEFFRLSGENQAYGVSSDGSRILARPYFDALVGQESSRLVSFPGNVEGSIGVTAQSKLRSALLNGRASLIPVNKFCEDPCNPADRIDWILGYRYLELTDSIVFSENRNSLLSNNPETSVLSESFESKNELQALQLGIIYKANFRRAWLESLMRVAVGNNRQQIRIRGNTTITDLSGTNSYNGGLLAQRSNIGEYKRKRFVMVPELGLNMGVRLTRCLHATLGYSVLYFPSVARASDQIDTDVNSNLIPPEANPFSGPLRPEFNYVESSYWAHGVNLGAELNF